VDDGALATHHKKKKKKKKKKKPGFPFGKKAAAKEPPPPPPDGDSDGVVDADDKCAEQAEDIDGFEDDVGCPDDDNDGDKIKDAEDACPDEAENVDGWDDEDGCPEAPPSIAPLLIDATLVDGTRVQGKVIRIQAVDEDGKDTSASEPVELGVIVDEVHEFTTPWANIKTMTSDKVTFMDGINCYSEGAELGEPITWECTVKHPTRLYLGTSDRKGSHYALDRKMQRYDFKIDELSCTGDSCETVEAERGLSLYFYKLMALVKNDEESEALQGLQVKLRAMQKRQIRKATLKPAE